MDSLLSFLTTAHLGLAFSDTSLRVAKTLKKGSALRASLPLPPNAIVHGSLVNPDQVLSELKKLLQAMVIKKEKAIVLLPAERVYTLLVTVPAEDALHPERVAKAITEHFPEPLDEVVHMSKVLRKAADYAEIGVVAVRRDVLKPYLELCALAKLPVAGITTTPAVLATTMNLGPTAPTTLLVDIVSSTLTLFFRGWPIDEAILPPSITPVDVTRAVEQMCLEYQAGTQAIAQIRVQAPATLVTNLQTALFGLKGIAIAAAFPGVSQEDQAFVDVVGAAQGGVKKLTFNLAQKSLAIG